MFVFKLQQESTFFNMSEEVDVYKYNAKWYKHNCEAQFNGILFNYHKKRFFLFVNI